MRQTEPRRLTDKQSKILKWVITYIEERRYPPSIREIGDAHNIASTNGVFDHLNALCRKSYIKRDYFTSRSIRILRTPDGKPFLDPADQLVEARKQIKSLKRFALTHLKAKHPVLERIDALAKTVA